MQFRDLKAQYQALKPQMDAAVIEVMSDAGFIGGARVSGLEKRLADYVGVKHCITCANGTDALTLGLKAWGIGPGDAVFVPDFTYFASAEVIALVGATPVFIDVCEDSFNIDAASLEAAIKRVLSEGRLKPKAVIPVDLFGLPADYPAVMKIAAQYGLKVLEDGAQGFGGMIGEQRACSFGDISTTSFFPAKPVGCYGDGGAVFTNDDAAAGLIRSLAVHGKGNDKYDNIRVGMNSRLDAIQAAVLSVKLDAFENYELEDVNKAARWYTEYLPDSLVKPVVPEGFLSSWAQYTVKLDSKERRDKLQAELKTQGIPTMIYYPKAMHSQGAFAEIPYEGTCPTTEKLVDTVLSLPMHPYLTEEMVKTVAKAVGNSL